jgi:hypothetical protein
VARSRQIERGLPFAVDALALCLTAGQSLLAAISPVSREHRLMFEPGAVKKRRWISAKIVDF